MIKRNMQNAGILAHARSQVALSGNAKKRESGLEVAAVELLRKLKIGFEREVLVDRFVVDFLLVNFLLAIEVNGRYWHSNERQKQRDHEKKKACAEQGWRLLTLWGDERHLWLLQLCEALGVDLAFPSTTSR